MIRGEHSPQIWKYVRNPKHESFDAPTIEELIEET
jgi:hypothetical protein